MKRTRILMVTHAPLQAEYGAAQMVINLAAAMRVRGHEVVIWSPHPLPRSRPWWPSILQARAKLNRFVSSETTFDIIIVPSEFITKPVTQAAECIWVMSVQNDVQYLFYSFCDHVQSTIKGIAKAPYLIVCTLLTLWLLHRGWLSTRYIFCLGSINAEWMRKWVPWCKNKIVLYFNALSEAEQKALARIREQRRYPATSQVRFLWIGRWSRQKGNDVLLSFVLRRAATHPQDRFTIAGCGAQAERDFPERLLASGQVKILPYFHRQELNELLANHDVGLFTSKVEGWGLVLNEMLESGMIVFTTESGAVQDLKPFFPEMLRPFPPCDNILADSFYRPPFPRSYYEIFSWDKIAEVFLSHLEPAARPKIA